MPTLYTEYEAPSLLRFLTPDEQQILFAHSESYDFNPGEHIIFQRDSEAILYLIESGKVEVLAGQGADATRLATLEAGEVIGEISFLADQRRSANVVAINNSTIRFFEPDRIFPILQQHEGLAARFYYAICHILAKRLMDYNKKTVETSSFKPLPVEACIRVKHPTSTWAREMLFHSAQICKEIPGGVEITFPYSVQPALLRQVLSLGPDAQVLKPEGFRQQLAQAAQQMMQNHLG